MPIKLEVGQCWKGIGSYWRLGIFKISRIIDHEAWCNIIYDGIVSGRELSFIGVDDQGCVTDMNFNIHWELVNIKLRKPIPDIPMDLSLPILMAGHLQDRQRKQYRPNKNDS